MWVGCYYVCDFQLQEHRAHSAQASTLDDEGLGPGGWGQPVSTPGTGPGPGPGRSGGTGRVGGLSEYTRPLLHPDMEGHLESRVAHRHHEPGTPSGAPPTPLLPSSSGHLQLL